MNMSSFNFSDIESNYKTYVLNTPLDKIKTLLDILDDSYYNGKSLVSDAVYDYISDYYYQSINQNRNKVGAIVHGKKIKLPIYMGSMDKLKPGSSALTQFFKNYTNEKCISEKVDGVSLLIEYSKKGPIIITKAYTRGDGEYGQDVTPILQYLKIGKLPSNEPLPYYVRGELIINKSNWDKISDKGENARNYVSGVIHRKNINKDDLEYIDFVAHEYVNPNLHLKISEQLSKLKQYNFHVVRFSVYKNITDLSELSDILVKYKNESIYEIDGLIIQDDVYYDRYTSGNPKYAKAFKDEKEMEQIETSVLGIKWEASQSKKLKPVVLLKPVKLKGVTISNVTGNNANYIQTNGLGKGAQVVIIRSGDVIPKILSVKVKVEPELPDVDYEWDTNHTDIILKNGDDNEEVLINQMAYFINATGIEFMKEGVLKKLFKVGVKKIIDIINLNKTTLLKGEGIKDKSAEKILESMNEKLNNIEIYTLLSGFPCFAGLGKIRIKAITTSIPSFLDMSKDELKNKILELNGFSDKLTQVFINGLDEGKLLLNEFKKKYSIKSEIAQVNQPIVNTDIPTNSFFNGKVFVFSGFRNQDYNKKIENMGGIIADGITKKTNYLVVKSLDESTSKTKKATEQGITILSEEQLVNKF